MSPVSCPETPPSAAVTLRGPGYSRRTDGGCRMPSRRLARDCASHPSALLSFLPLAFGMSPVLSCMPRVILLQSEPCRGGEGGVTRVRSPRGGGSLTRELAHSGSWGIEILGESEPLHPREARLLPFWYLATKAQQTRICRGHYLNNR